MIVSLIPSQRTPMSLA